MSEQDSKNIVTVSQNHSGPGDNVAEKHVYSAISPTVIQSTVEEVLTEIRHRNPRSASNKLRILSSTSQLNTEAKALISVLSILVAIANQDETPQGYLVVESCLQTKLDGFFSDIATSTQLRLDIQNERIDDAERLYQSTENLGEYSKEVFYEFLAQEHELENIFENNRHQLTEITLCGLTRGFIKLQSHANSVRSSERLLLRYSGFNSKVLNFIARCNYLDSQITTLHYWLITASERKQTLLLADECISLLDECGANDHRMVSQAKGFLSFFTGSYEPLVDACWKHINNIEAIDIDFGHRLRGLRDNSFEGLKDLSYEIEKAHKDSSYKASIIERLTKSHELSSSEDLILFINIANSTTIREWINNGGEISSEDELEKEFNQLELLCYANDGSPKYTTAITKAADSLLSKIKEEPCNLNPLRIKELSTILLRAGLATQVCALLHPMIPKTDIWLSPIVKIYINALLESQQLTTLDRVFSAINSNDWCEFLWQAKARELDYLNELDKAVSAMKKALELSPKSLGIWDYLIYLLKRKNTELASYQEYLNKIPTEILAKPNEQSSRLLFELAANGHYGIVENTIVNWFIDDPINSAIPITNFHVNESAIAEDNATRPILESTKNCLTGFRYSLDGKDTTKLIVHGTESKHSSIIKYSSPLAQQLLKMDIGQTVQYRAYDLTVLEKLPPYVAVFRLSLEIRHTTNDGSDCFYKFSLPEDPTEMMSSIEKKMIALDNHEKQEEFYKNPAYPLFLKGHLLGNDCAVLSALNQLTSKVSVKPSLPSIGVEQPDTIILDVYSVAYLALTGLIHGLERKQIKVVITVETQAYLEHFLENVNRNNYMRAGVNDEGKLWFITADDIKKQTENVQRGIKQILKIALIGQPHLADIPPDIIKIKEAVDLSVFSSLKLSITNNIPWLCIDEAFAQLAHKSNYPVVNAFNFFSQLSLSLDIDTKLPGLYLHVTGGLPYPLTYDDLLQMSNAQDTLSHYYLSEILRMYPGAYPNSDSAIQHLHKIILLALARAYEDGVFINGFSESNPGNNGYAVRLFNTCCYTTIQIQDGEEAERKLAKLLCTVIITAKGNPLICKLVSRLGTQFISGHFLCFDTVNGYIRKLLYD